MIEEPESEALAEHLKGDVLLATSRIASVEAARAVAIANSSGAAQHELDRLLTSCLLVTVSAQLLSAARRLVSPSVRTLDAIHLASALLVEPDELLAYDRRLLAAAGDRGLSVASPS